MPRHVSCTLIDFTDTDNKHSKQSFPRRFPANESFWNLVFVFAFWSAEDAQTPTCFRLTYRPGKLIRWTRRCWDERFCSRSRWTATWTDTCPVDARAHATRRFRTALQTRKRRISTIRFPENLIHVTKHHSAVFGDPNMKKLSNEVLRLFSEHFQDHGLTYRGILTAGHCLVGSTEENDEFCCLRKICDLHPLGPWNMTLKLFTLSITSTW